MATTRRKRTEPKFEEAVQRLEAVVEQLEEGELPLDTALERYEEGIQLAAACSKRLDEAKQRIERLMETTEGQLVTEPLFTEDEEDDE